MGLERDWTPGSTPVKGNKLGKGSASGGSGIGNAIEKLGMGKIDLLRDAQQQHHDLVGKAMDQQHEHESLLTHHENTKELLGMLPRRATEFENDSQNRKTTFKMSPPPAPRAKAEPKAPAAETVEGSPSLSPGIVTRHVNNMLAVKSNRKATHEDRLAVATNYGKLIGKYGQRAVDHAIRNHPKIKQA